QRHPGWLVLISNTGTVGQRAIRPPLSHDAPIGFRFHTTARLLRGLLTFDLASVRAPEVFSVVPRHDAGSYYRGDRPTNPRRRTHYSARSQRRNVVGKLSLSPSRVRSASQQAQPPRRKIGRRKSAIL